MPSYEPSFDLTRAPWIPVIRRGARRATPEPVSLRTALRDAHRIRAVHAPTPLQTMALGRLLQALVLRIFYPVGETFARDDNDRWWDLFEAERFDPAALAAYFDAWQDEKECFDLFHPERPFYQHPEPMTKRVKSMTNLFAGRASGNNETLFNHNVDDDPPSVTPAEAARGLVALQATALGGGRSKPFYYADAPLVSGTVFWMRGTGEATENLFHALLLNSPPYGEALLTPIGTGTDRPVWERMYDGGLPDPEKRPETGYLDYLTWPSRRVRLVPDTSDDGETVVRTLKISQGDKRTNDAVTDPLMARTERTKRGLRPLKLRKDKALWRDMHVVSGTQSDTLKTAPPTLQWASEEFDDVRWFVDAFGIVNDQSKIERWAHVRIPIYPAILTDDDRHAQLQDALKHADEQADTLKRATRECAAYLQYQASYASLGTQSRKDVRALATSLGTVARYWAALEDPFWKWLRQLGAPDADLHVLPAQWGRTLYRRARDAYDTATDSLGDTARQARAVAAGRSELHPVVAFDDILASVS